MFSVKVASAKSRLAGRSSTVRTMPSESVASSEGEWLYRCGGVYSWVHVCGILRTVCLPIGSQTEVSYFGIKFSLYACIHTRGNVYNVNTFQTILLLSKVTFWLVMHTFPLILRSVILKRYPNLPISDQVLEQQNNFVTTWQYMLALVNRWVHFSMHKLFDHYFLVSKYLLIWLAWRLWQFPSGHEALLQWVEESPFQWYTPGKKEVPLLTASLQW